MPQLLGPRPAFAALMLYGIATSAGCARTQSAPVAPASAPASAPTARPTSPMTDPGPLAERWRLPARILDGKTGQELTQTALASALDDVRVVYVAERHNSPHDHAVQLAVIDALRNRDPSLGIGLEMFKRPFQKWVTDYIEGRITEAEMLAKTEWADRWGFDFALYRPILAYAKKHKIPVYALNARDEITRTVARKGLKGLDPVDRKTLPKLDLSNKKHRAIIKEVFDGHGMGKKGHGGMRFKNFYTAQVIWDETMAHEVANELKKPDAPRRIVVLAGGGHIRYGHGIPQRAARRGAKPYRTIYPLIEPDDDDLVGSGLADFLWLMHYESSPES